jgi:endogenous inhibitor of DNA gyrase (YacG/DUF329 family)
MAVLDFEFKLVTPEEALRIWEPWKVQVDVACLNCDRVFTAAGSRAASYLFCSESCKQVAKNVRWARRRLADGTIDRPDIAEALRTRIAFMLSGGYPERARRVPPATRQQVIARSGGKCENCGQPFLSGPDAGDRRLTIQHVRGSSNDLANLRAFCSRCNTLDMQSRQRPVTDPAKLKQARAFERRYRSKRPTRACDDERHWRSVWRIIGKRRFMGEQVMTGPLRSAALRNIRPAA